jgi:hypothetical protein
MDKSYIVSYTNIVKQEDILVVFIKKQSGVRAMQILLYNLICIGLD